MCMETVVEKVENVPEIHLSSSKMAVPAGGKSRIAFHLVNQRNDRFLKPCQK